MPSVVIRPKALADLADIWAYIAEDSVRHADAFVARIDQEFQMLARRPGLGRSRPELFVNLRSLPVGKYVIFYMPHRRGIQVIRVLHGARDLKSMFEED